MVQSTEDSFGFGPGIMFCMRNRDLALETEHLFFPYLGIRRWLVFEFVPYYFYLFFIDNAMKSFVAVTNIEAIL
jgi:hypothetical protein